MGSVFKLGLGKTQNDFVLLGWVSNNPNLLGWFFGFFIRLGGIFY
jgi:hypothetical protein